MSGIEVIPQRQLRNDISGVLRRVAGGSTYIITVSGKQVATLTPVDQPRYQRRRPVGELRRVKRVHLAQTTSAILDELREERI